MDTVFGIEVDRAFGSVADLREEAKAASRFVNNKVIDHIDALAARFIAASPLAFLATRRPDGGLDMTPRGDPAGFVHILDEKTLALPDRPGNFRMDAFENILETGEAALIFVIPGHGDTLRVSGKAKVVRDAALGERLAISGRPAAYVTLIRVERVLSHCPKAFVRGRIWQPDHWPDRSGVPTLAEMMVAHSDLPDPVEEVEEIVKRDGETRLY
ncbi:MSMEG_1061 family FMN-dependent PPOX-type flavoprotein [Nioella aestuarii]|uniref:MSMEG_1061 family FMN-dependent PPOX-type flavoprotein n=1 Tax=Nioella aestuarii TaxID=1662864 RepID=UPI003D7F4EAC